MASYLAVIVLMSTLCLITQATRPRSLSDSNTVTVHQKRVTEGTDGFTVSWKRKVEKVNKNEESTVLVSKTNMFHASNNFAHIMRTLSNKDAGRVRNHKKRALKLEYLISTNNVSKMNSGSILKKRMADIGRETSSFNDLSTEKVLNVIQTMKYISKSPSTGLRANRYSDETMESMQPTVKLNEADTHSSRTRDKARSAHNLTSSNIHVNIDNKKLIRQGHPLYCDKTCTYESTKCDLSDCFFKFVPDDLPTIITELLLDHNYIATLTSNAFFRYRQLEILNLAMNPVDAIKNGVFNGLSRLTSLDLTDIFYQKSHDLPENIFEPLRSLKILRMNALYQCPQNPAFIDATLSYLHNLEELYINNYNEHNEDFGPGFINMTLLRHMSVICDDCQLDSLWNTTFKSLGHITSLDISNCQIEGQNIETETFTHFKNLSNLDISHNPNIGIEYLPVILLKIPSLLTLRMNNIVNEHSLTIINSSLVRCLPNNLTTLVARGNNIISIELNTLRVLPKTLKTIDINGNYIFTDPDDIRLEELEGLETLKIQNNGRECKVHDKYTNNHSPADTLKRHNNTLYKTDKKLGERMLTSRGKLNQRIPPKLKRVQISVSYMPADFMLHIDPDNNLEELDLSCSYIPEFDLDSLYQLPNLKYLNIRKSSVRKLLPVWTELIPLKTLILESNNLNDFLNAFSVAFMYLCNLSYLDLASNQLHNVPKDLFEGLDNIEYLLLADNPLPQFDADISNMRQLKLLNLSNTELSHLPNDVISHIDQLCKGRPSQIRVDMEGCPIQCDCLNLDFLKWVVNSPAFDKNFTGYKCRYPDTSFRYIVDGYQETILVLDKECAKNYPMFLLVLAATSVLLFAVIGAILYRVRWKIRYLYYAAYLKFTDKHKNDNNHEFTYDVFVSYDSEDQAFVTKHLSPELENRGLKLLIHTRDFVAGTYITSNIVMAVTESRKTLVVLTRNLVESTWCNYELQMATMEAVHTGRQVLVFLLKDTIPSRELDVELLGHIRSNTYLPYPTPEEEEDAVIMRRFYDKLAHDLRC